MYILNVYKLYELIFKTNNKKKCQQETFMQVIYFGKVECDKKKRLMKKKFIYISRKTSS